MAGTKEEDQEEIQEREIMLISVPVAEPPLIHLPAMAPLYDTKKNAIQPDHPRHHPVPVSSNSKTGAANHGLPTDIPKNWHLELTYHKGRS